jgi:membrane fusion protein (multidrug efflux system)
VLQSLSLLQPERRACNHSGATGRCWHKQVLQSRLEGRSNQIVPLLRAKLNLVNKQVQFCRPVRFASLAMILVSCLFTAGCQPANVYQEPPPPPVTVANPELRKVVDTIIFTGTTEAVEMVDIRARVEGFLLSIEFDEGKAVKKGDLLFRIDPRPFDAALAQAEASVELATAREQSAQAELLRTKAEVINAETQLDRVKKAIRISPGAVTQEELVLRDTAVKTAKAAEAAAEASISSANAQIAAGVAMVEQADLELSYTEVLSPIDGRAGRKLVDVGNLVGAGESTLLTNVISYDPVYGFFTVSETDLLKFNRQQIEREASSSSDEEMKLDRTIFLGLGDEEGFPHEGKADYADLAVDQSTGTFLIRGVFPNAKRLIPPGAFIRVQVPGDEIEVLLIDERAIGRDQAGAYLLVIDPNNTVERRTVQLSGKYHGMQAVSGPIGPDDRVIVNGLQRARPGAKVAPQLRQPAAEEKDVEQQVDDSPSPPDTAE